jgi:hypothetical protein
LNPKEKSYIEPDLVIDTEGIATAGDSLKLFDSSFAQGNTQGNERG